MFSFWVIWNTILELLEVTSLEVYALLAWKVKKANSKSILQCFSTSLVPGLYGSTKDLTLLLIDAVEWIISFLMEQFSEPAITWFIQVWVLKMLNKNLISTLMEQPLFLEIPAEISVWWEVDIWSWCGFTVFIVIPNRAAGNNFLHKNAFEDYRSWTFVWVFCTDSGMCPHGFGK